MGWDNYPHNFLVSFSIVLSFIVFYYLLIVVGSLAIIYKRKSKHLLARNLSYMFLTVFSSISFISIFVLRVLIGRKIFPCALYTLSMFLVMIIILPSICRSVKLFFSYKLNVLKMKLIENKSDEEVKEGCWKERMLTCQVRLH